MSSLSFRRLMWSRNFWIVLVLASLPLGLAVMFCVGLMATMGYPAQLPRGDGNFRRFVELVFDAGYLSLGVIFAGVAFGSSAIREEQDDQTLHYFFLQPAARWIILLGKFTAFLAFTYPVFLVSLLLVRVLVLAPFGIEGFREHLISGSELMRFAREAIALAVGLIAYSMLFLALSSIIKNNVYALFIYGWEVSSHFLPDALKSFSLGWHLREIVGSRQEAGVVEVLAVGPSMLQVVLVLSLTPVICGGVAALIFSRRQCLYGTN